MRASGAVHVLLNAPATPPQSRSLVVAGIAGKRSPTLVTDCAAWLTPEVDGMPALRHHAGGGGPSEPGGELMGRSVRSETPRKGRLCRCDDPLRARATYLRHRGF